MRHLILILSLITAISGCHAPPVVELVERVDVAKPARDIISNSNTIADDAASGAEIAVDGRSIAPDLPHWDGIITVFRQIADKASRIASKASEIEAAQESIDAGNEREAVLRAEIAEYRASDRQWRARAWGMLALGGAILLVLAAVSLMWSARLVTGSLALGGIAALVIGSTMASSEGIVVWLGVGVAVVIAVSAAYWAISRRSAVDRSWDRIADLARDGLDGKDDLRAFLAAMRAKFDQFDKAMEASK